MNPEQNLDYLAAQHAQAIVQSLTADQKADPKKAENTLTKTLGVLQEDGVYACFLYLYAREGKNGEVIASKMLELFKSLQLSKTPEKSDKESVLKYVADELTVDLPTLLLAKEALERLLIYARYGAKAAENQPNNQPQRADNQEAA